MTLRPVQINIKAVDQAAIGRFWAGVLGWDAYRQPETTYVGPPGGLVWPHPTLLGIDVIPVPEPKGPAKNRVHLDLATTSAAHQAEVITRARDLGATDLDIGQGDVPWTVLADPEGNEFCVLEPREIYRDTGPIAAIVVDCTDPRDMARFWGSAIDWPLHEVTDNYASLRAAGDLALGVVGGPFLEFLRVPGDTAEPGRIHLDLLPRTVTVAAKIVETDRLRSLGAADLDVGQGDVPWTCLTDPDGHEFCVLGPHE